MLCPFDKEIGMLEVKRDYHHLTRQLAQPMNTILSIQYECPDCGVRVETSQQVRVTPAKADWISPEVKLKKAYEELEEIRRGEELNLRLGQKEEVHEGEDTTIGGNEHQQNTKPRKPRRKVRRKKSSNI